MDKFKEKMEEIEMNQFDKERILNNITEYADKKSKRRSVLTFKKLTVRFAAFIMSIIAVASTVYATIKIFNIDEKLSAFFGKNSDELKEIGISASDVSKTYETEDAIITVNQTVIDEKEIYISLDIDGKKEPIYIEEIKTSDEQNIFGAYSVGFQLIEEYDNHVSYVLNSSINGVIENDTVITATLYMSNNTSANIKFNVSKNDMKVKEIKTNAIIYNNENIIATVTAIRITPLHIIFDIEYNVDLNTLDENTIMKLREEIYDYSDYRETYFTLTNGRVQPIALWCNSVETMLSPYTAYAQDLQIINIEELKSVTINGVVIAVD